MVFILLSSIFGSECEDLAVIFLVSEVGEISSVVEVGRLVEVWLGRSKFDRAREAV